MKRIKEYILPAIIAISALSVSASAAFYSVSGLSKLFAGASLEVMIMAGSLEVAKLVIATLLHRYWKTISKLLKIYLSTALVVLVLITSMGIYGFLSAAYQETANKAGNLDAQIELLEVKRNNFTEQLSGYTEEKEALNQSISELRAGLAGNKIQYKDKETGEIITTTSSSNRRAFERQLDQALERQDVLNEKIDGVNQSIFDLETEIVEVKTGNDLAGELGPLKYLSDLTGIGMDSIINYLLLVIIFVFDPLAIALVIAANFAFEQLKPKVRENIYGEKEEVDWDTTLEDGLREVPWEVETEEVPIEDLLHPEEGDWKEETIELDIEEILNSEKEPNEALKQAAEKYEQREEEDWVVVDEDEEVIEYVPGKITKQTDKFVSFVDKYGRRGTINKVPGENKKYVEQPDDENIIRYL